MTGSPTGRSTTPRRKRRDDERPRRHGGFRERGLRPARPGRGARGGPRHGLRHGHHHPPRRVPRRGHRRPADRGHAAGDGERLRDPRQRRHPQHGDRDQQGGVPQRRHGRSRGGGAHPRLLRRGRLRGDRRAQGRDHLGYRGGAGHLLAGRGRQDGDHRRLHGRLVRGLHAAVLDRGLGRLRGRQDLDGLGCFGGTYAAPIWHDYMLAAQGSDCPDFPAPENPVEFSTWTRFPYRQRADRHATLRRHPRGPAAPPPPTTAPGAGSTNGEYPSDLYAPGVGAGPAPSPGGGGGGGGGGNGGGGGAGTGGEGPP